MHIRLRSDKQIINKPLAACHKNIILIQYQAPPKFQKLRTSIYMISFSHQEQVKPRPFFHKKFVKYPKLSSLYYATLCITSASITCDLDLRMKIK